MQDYDALKREWREKGEIYAAAVNQMVQIGEDEGWDDYDNKKLEAALLKSGMAQEQIAKICYEEDEIIDNRADMSEAVLGLLREANASGETAKFRADFPPSNAVITDAINKQLGDISHICALDENSVIFIVRRNLKSTAYLLVDDKVSKIGDGIVAIGRAKRGEIYALINENGEIAVVRNLRVQSGAEGLNLAENTEAVGSNSKDLYAAVGSNLSNLSKAGGSNAANLAATSGSNLLNLGSNLSGELVTVLTHKPHEYGDLAITPFNDGSRVLIADHGGIFIVGSDGERLIHPIYEEGETDEPYIDMHHAALSNDNELIVAGEQCFQALFDANGEKIADIEPPCSYPHFALFSKDDSQLISNACHFYNGDTIGIARELLNTELNLEYDEDMDCADCVKIDAGMRAYAGVATRQGYILGDAYGYIKAMDTRGGKIWRHYLGGTICSMAISGDERTLWVGTYGGRLHRLKLGSGQDSLAIGNGDHKEEFRLLAFKSGEILKW